MYNGFIYVNAMPFPYPDKESGLQTAVTLVDAGRNAEGVMTGEVVGNPQRKIELSWSALTPEVWSEILQTFERSFVCIVSYFDMVKNDWTTRRMYVNDRSATPYLVDKETGRPKYWRNCKLNLIDTGEGEI